MGSLERQTMFLTWLKSRSNPRCKFQHKFDCYIFSERILSIKPF